MHDLGLDQAARVIATADALLIGAGAGMGVDSGLPDFRGNNGFWRAIRLTGISGWISSPWQIRAGSRKTRRWRGVSTVTAWDFIAKRLPTRGSRFCAVGASRHHTVDSSSRRMSTASFSATGLIRM